MIEECWLMLYHYPIIKLPFIGHVTLLGLIVLGIMFFVLTKQLTQTRNNNEKPNT